MYGWVWGVFEPATKRRAEVVRTKGVTPKTPELDAGFVTRAVMSLRHEVVGLSESTHNVKVQIEALADDLGIKLAV